VPIYIAGSLVLICATPWPKQLTRYFLPLAPFVALAVVLLLERIRVACDLHHRRRDDFDD
jgi:hypothetical protein